MPAVSKAQQRFFGMVHAAQKGEKPASKDVADVAKDISKKDAKDFASTSHEGLPTHVKKEFAYPTNKELWKECMESLGKGAKAVKQYELKGGGWRLGEAADERVYNKITELYANEIKPIKEAKAKIRESLRKRNK